MRLLVDAHVFDEVPQGTRTYLKGLYTEIITSNDDIEIFFCARDIGNLRVEFGDHPNVTYLKLRSSTSLFRLIFELPWLIKSNKIDIAHFQYISPLVKTCKEIVTIHDVLFLDYPNYFPIHYRIFKSILFRRSARRSDLIFTVSEYSRAAIARHFEIPGDRIYLTPNAVSQEFFMEIEPSRKDTLKVKYHLGKFILYVSRIEPRKNQIILLRAFHELELWKSGYALVFIGRTDIAVDEFNDYLAGLRDDIRAHIRVLDNISYDELQAFYKSCEMFVYPSFAEGFGIPPLEAAASQRIVICSSTTAMEDFDFFKDTFFEPNDLDQLKRRILENIDNRDEYKARRIQAAIQRRYSWKIIGIDFVMKLKTIQLTED